MMLSVEQIYATAAFQLLAQGMKDRKAEAIVMAIARDDIAFRWFENWARDELDSEIDSELDAELARVVHERTGDD